MNTHAVVKWCSSGTSILINMVEISAFDLSSGEDLEGVLYIQLKGKTENIKLNY